MLLALTFSHTIVLPLSPPRITVTTAIRHPRLRYVLRVVGDDLGYEFRFRNDRSVFGTPTPQFGINYGGQGPKTLPHHGLLAGKAFAPAAPPPLSSYRGLPALCQTPQGPDLLACIFYALSRYEEYQPFVPDAHGRFPGASSHAARYGYLHRPIVREWTALLGQQLREWFPDLPPPRRRPLDPQPTYDIDLLWAYRYRGWRGVAHGVKDVLTGRTDRALQRFSTTESDDPFNTIAQLEQLHREAGLRATYFWLLADGTDRHDTNPYPIPAAQQEIMRALEATADQGIHPSYRSTDDAALLAQECSRMERIVGRPITRSRQHFLRLTLPQTYRQLLAHGIADDYSMGYADRVGWRAGTNLPFPWYDLERERETKLTIHPFAAMDVTLKNYLGLTGGAAGAKLSELRTALEPFGGPFALLWHNSSFAPDYGWAGWWEMYQGLFSKNLEVSLARSAWDL